MTLYLGIRALVFIGGLLLFALSANAKVTRIGEVMMFCGLLTLLMGTR